jgi:hypothetical protein
LLHLPRSSFSFLTPELTFFTGLFAEKVVRWQPA